MMEITLKNVKVAAFASRETTCFEATIYIDGKRAGTASNDGGGGCDRYHFADRDLERRFHEYCKSLPPLDDDGEFGPMPMDADLYLAGLMEKMDLEKRYRRIVKDATAIRLKGAKDGEFLVFKRPFTVAQRRAIAERYGDAIDYFLNEKLGQAAC